MMTIEQMVKAFEDRGFKVRKYWNQHGHGSYEFTIIKNDVYVGGRYEWHPELSPDVIAAYQRNFFNELLEKWNKEHDRYCREQIAKGLTEGITNTDPELKQYAKQILNSIYGVNTMTEMLYRRDELRMKTITTKPTIKDVIFNNPATIVFWSDGTKTVVKCQDGDIYDPEKGLAMAISKKFLGNKGNYCNEINKWMDKYTEKIADEINPFEFAWTSIQKSVMDSWNKINSSKATETQPVTTDDSKKQKILATMEFEVDISNLDPEYTNVMEQAKNIARNELRDLMLSKEINADNFNYEIVITNKE